MLRLFYAILPVFLAPLLYAEIDAFDYLEWTNKDGNAMEARLDRIDGEKVILQAKKGGKRHPLKREVLSKESQDRIDSYIADTKRRITGIRKNAGAKIPCNLVYRAAALGLEKEILSLGNRYVSCTISGVRVDKRLTAIIEFEQGCFREIRSADGKEFFIKEDTLYVRSSTKDYRPYPGSKINRGASRLIKPGAGHIFQIRPETQLKWDRVGVSEGPVFR